MAVRALVSVVEGAGVLRERFLAAAGISSGQLDDGTARIPQCDYRRAVQAALSSSGDATLGLRMGEHANTAWFDVLGHLAQDSASLREALHICDRYSRIVRDGLRLELLEHGERATIRIAGLTGDLADHRFVAEFTLSALWLHLVRRFIAEAARPHRVLFAHPEPAHGGEYARIFRGRVQFSQPFNGLEFERSWLDRQQLHHSPELCALLRTRADLLLARLEHDTPVSERVRRCLLSVSWKDKPSMDSIAKKLGMSARSLRRRLCEEGADFRLLLEQARADHAKRALAAGHLSVQEAAYELGFATPAAFTRAFRRWTGLSPSAFRAAR